MRDMNFIGETIILLDAVIVNTTSPVLKIIGPYPLSVMAKIAGTSGTQSGLIDVYGTVFNELASISAATRIARACKLGQLQPQGTTNAYDFLLIENYFPYLFCDLTALSGTGAACSVGVAH